MKIIGDSQHIEDIKKFVNTAAGYDYPVYLGGETGTGKSIVASIIHERSRRSRFKFIYVNCNSIPENLIESTLFGHVKGAFTGAIASKGGLLDEADGGTLFIDEISSMSHRFQSILLDLLERNSFRAVGSQSQKHVDIRYIFASNQKLADLVRKGRFRLDLYYRINVFKLEILPLKERREDIYPLLDYYMDKICTDLNLKVKAFEPDALEELERYRWPGNVRELINIVKKLAIYINRDVVTKDDLINLKIFDDDPLASFNVSDPDQQMTLSELSQILGISRKTLWKRKRKLLHD